MAAADGFAVAVTEGASGGPSFRDVPWLVSDVLVGLAPMVAVLAAHEFGNWSTFDPALGRFLTPLGLLAEVWMAAFPLWVARKRLGLPRLPRFRRVGIEAGFALLALPVVMATMAAFTAAMVRVLGDAGLPGTTLEPVAGSPDRAVVSTLVVLAVVAAPVCEEILFRGLVYNAIRQRLGSGPALVIQAAAFGLLHPFGLSARAAIAVIGLLLGGLYEWRKTLLAPVILHALINTLALAAMIANVGVGEETPSLGVAAVTRDGGCLVTDVLPGGGAEAAGLLAGDRITAVDGLPVEDFGALIRVVRARRIGDTVPVEFVRGGRPGSAEVELRTRPK